MTRALIVVDVQNDFCAGGPLAVPDGEFVVPPINELMRSGLYETIVLTQDWHPMNHTSFAENHPGAQPLSIKQMKYGDQILWPTHCLQASRGAQFHPALDTTCAHAMIRKGMNPKIDSYSAFRENDKITPTGLAGLLSSRFVTHVDVCGLALDFCVKYTALDAVEFGFHSRVLTHASRAIDPANLKNWDDRLMVV